MISYKAHPRYYKTLVYNGRVQSASNVYRRLCSNSANVNASWTYYQSCNGSHLSIIIECILMIYEVILMSSTSTCLFSRASHSFSIFLIITGNYCRADMLKLGWCFFLAENWSSAQAHIDICFDINQFPKKWTLSCKMDQSAQLLYIYSIESGGILPYRIIIFNR